MPPTKPNFNIARTTVASKDYMEKNFPRSANPSEKWTRDELIQAFPELSGHALPSGTVVTIHPAVYTCLVVD
jgi:hypothetical protein